jgi:predicted nucleic-acid-binding protein
MRAVDTNVVVRLLTRDDPEQTASAEAFVATGAWVPQIVLVEATWVLAAVYRLPPAKIAAAVEMLLNHRDLTIQDAEVVAAALGLFQSRSGLGFSDCLILEAARKAGHLPLATFDRGLGRVKGVQSI